jgi:hypothetical protein
MGAINADKFASTPKYIAEVGPEYRLTGNCCGQDKALHKISLAMRTKTPELDLSK